MKEQAFTFGDKSGLCGVITDPKAKNTDLPGLIILNSGLIPHVGPNRLSVRLARRAATSGFTCLRFDFSGIGDSALRDDHLPFEESAPMEVIAAMDFLGKARGISTFILTGICSGADTSFFTALKDERVVGIAPVDFYGVGSVGYQLKNYRRRLIQPRSWLNLATGKSDIWGLVAKLPEKLRSNKQEESIDIEDEVNGSFPAVRQIVDHYKSLFERNFKAYLLYSAGSPAYYNYSNSFKSALKSYAYKGVLRVSYLQHADHGFTLRYNQEQYLENLEAWLKSSF